MPDDMTPVAAVLTNDDLHMLRRRAEDADYTAIPVVPEDEDDEGDGTQG
jgi:hypothetical protein